jgi:choline transporter-like protein 2/4/5
MVWASIFLTIAAVFALGTYLFKIAQTWAEQDPQLHSKTFINGTEIASYVIFGIGALLFFLIIYLRKEIHLAVALIKTAAASIGSMPMIMTFPIFQSAFYIVFVVTWIYYVANLASMGEVVPKEYSLESTNVSVNSYQFDNLTWELAWYLLFAFFWTTSFIGAMGQLIIAMCAARWYFTRDKSKITSGTVWSSMCIVLRYHTGTAAFGSLIIAIILLIRAIVMYFQKKAEQMNKTLAGILFCCCQCCLWCFQKCMEFINKNAYIYTSMFGTPFCKSAREGFGLIVRNAARVGTLSYVSVLVVFVGRLFISSATAAASWVIMQHYIGKELYSLAGPTVLILIIAYHVSDMFMQVFNMTASTILHCFVADEEMYESAEQYATGDLREYIEKNEHRARKILKVEG